MHITGDEWKAVALDEAHEMCINNDMKWLLVIQLRIISELQNWPFIQELFPERLKKDTSQKEMIADGTAHSKGVESNIMAMVMSMVENNLLQVNVESLVRKLANPVAGSITWTK